MVTEPFPYAAEVPGPFGTADTMRYDDLQTSGALGIAPYADDAATLEGYFSFAVPSAPEDIVFLSRLVVRGKVLAFGRPHFNSTNGIYWSPGLHEEPGVVDVALGVSRDVIFQIDEVLGDAIDSGLKPGMTVVFTSRGGQVRVTPAAVSKARAKDPELPEHAADLPTLPFVISDAPPVDLAIGEEAVLFLNWRSVDGLYEGRYGYKFDLFPANEVAYRFKIEGDLLTNDLGHTLSLGDLPGLIDSLLGSGAGEMPEPGVHKARPHPPVVETGSPATLPDEPEHDHGEGE